MRFASTGASTRATHFGSLSGMSERALGPAYEGLYSGTGNIGTSALQSFRGCLKGHSMTLPYRPGAVVFDMDGLLFDTEALWQEALLSAAAEGRHEVADELFSKSIGVPRSQCRALFLSHFGEDFLFDDFHANWVRHFWRSEERRVG